MMRASAEDDADWQRTRTQLYAPPKGYTPRRGGAAGESVVSRAGAGMTLDQVKALMGQVAAEDAQYGRHS